MNEYSDGEVELNNGNHSHRRPEICRAFEHIKPIEKRVFILLYLARFKISEITTILKISGKTVYNWKKEYYKEFKHLFDQFKRQ